MDAEGYVSKIAKKETTECNILLMMGSNGEHIDGYLLEKGKGWKVGSHNLKVALVQCWVHSQFLNSKLCFIHIFQKVLQVRCWNQKSKWLAGKVPTHSWCHLHQQYCEYGLVVSSEITQAHQLKWHCRLLLNVKFALFERIFNLNSTRGNSRGCFNANNGQVRKSFGFRRNSDRSNDDQDIDGYDDLNLLLTVLKREGILCFFLYISWLTYYPKNRPILHSFSLSEPHRIKSICY